MVVGGDAMLESYLELLGAWGLWHVRVQTEALLVSPANAASSSGLLFGNSVAAGPTVPAQVSLSCTFCGRAVATKAGRHRYSAPGGQKLSVCNHCRKPLPRCSVCRRHMGGPLPRGEDRDEEGGQGDLRSHRLGGWMTWCQSCRHGGHSRHLAAWFAQAQECPVVGCACRCGLLDAPHLAAAPPPSPRE